MNPLTDRERLAHNAATICSACKCEFTKNNYKVHHHCHVTGQYIAPVCNNCNLQLKNRKFGNKSFIPLFMHNARSYDSHFIIKNLHNANAKVQVIPTNSEKFLAVQIDSIRFLDSFQFLSSSLDKLVSTMARDNTDKFVHTKRHFGSNDPNIFKKRCLSIRIRHGSRNSDRNVSSSKRQVLQRTERGRNLGGRLRLCIGDVAAL